MSFASERPPSRRMTMPSRRNNGLEPLFRKKTLHLTPHTCGRKPVHMWYFYILQSKKDQNYFYKGSTNDLRRRLVQHNDGLVHSTTPRRPFRLVYYEAYVSEWAARMREAAVKKSGSVSVPLIKRIKESLTLDIGAVGSRKR